MNNMLIAGYLQLLRKRQGLTQEILAEKLHVSRQAVSKWETGSGLPDLEILLRLSEIYGITINDILCPQIERNRIADFEEMDKMPQECIEKIGSYVEPQVLVKASIGASPRINEWLAGCFPQIHFKEERCKIGRIRISEVEEAQNDIVELVNFMLAEEME